MSHFPSLPDEASMLHAMRLNPAASRLLVAYHTEVMRGPSALSQGERELIAAYVSGLNACRYCVGVHEATAAAFGVAPGLLASLLDDPHVAAAPPAMRPVLNLARKLTLEQSRTTAADVEAVLDEGWDERAAHDAINVVALFNFMNRYVYGHGLSLSDDALAERGRRLMSEGYEPLHVQLINEETP
jgi:uncharacterized peroxidase-related enzyme